MACLVVKGFVAIVACNIVDIKSNTGVKRCHCAVRQSSRRWRETNIPKYSCLYTLY